MLTDSIIQPANQVSTAKRLWPETQILISFFFVCVCGLSIYLSFFSPIDHSFAWPDVSSVMLPAKHRKVNLPALPPVGVMIPINNATFCFLLICYQKPRNWILDLKKGKPLLFIVCILFLCVVNTLMSLSA